MMTFSITKAALSLAILCHHTTTTLLTSAHPTSHSTCYSNHLNPNDPTSLGYYQSIIDYLDSTSAPSPGLGELEPVSAEKLNQLADSPVKLETDIQVLHISALLSFLTLRYDENGMPYHITRGRERNRYGLTAAMLLAAHHFNTGNGEVVSEIEGIHERCPVRIGINFHDAESNRRSAVDTLTNSILNKNGRLTTTAVFGELFSSTSIPTATLTGVYGVAQLCPSCTSTELDDTQQYPKFARLIPSDAGTARSIISFAQQKNAESNGDTLRYMGVLYKNDAFGTAFYLALKESEFYWVFSSEFEGGDSDNADEYEPGTLNVRGSHFSSEEEIDEAVAALAETGYRVFVGIFYTNDYEAVMLAAHKYGIAGPGYTWILGDGFGPDYFKDKSFIQGSPLAVASQGLGVFMASGGRITEEGNTGYDRILKSWRGGTAETVDYLNCVGHPRTNSLNSSLYYEAEADYFQQPDEPPKIVFFYDSVVALGMAACALLEEDAERVLNGEDLTNTLVQQKFGGSSGFVNIDSQTHSRTANSAFFVAYNAQGTTGEDGNTTFSIEIVSHTLPSEAEDAEINWVSVPGKQYQFSDGSNMMPLSLPEIEGFETNQLSTAVRAVFLFLAAVIFGLSLFFTGWTFHHRNNRVVRASQPPFLYLICAGTFIMAATIVTLSIDDSIATQAGCDAACMMSPWFLSVGFVFSFSSLFAKEWRINRILNNPGLKRMKVEARDVVAPFVILLLLNVLVLSLWTALSPLTWQRYFVGRVDQFGRELESLGTCTGSSRDDWAPYVGVLLAINGAMVFLASYQSYRARSISVEFSESKYVAMILTAILQALVIGIPIIVIVSENPTASFVVKASLVFLLCGTILLCMFIPKMLFLRDNIIEEKKKAERQKDKLARIKRANESSANASSANANSSTMDTSDTLDRRSSLQDGSESMRRSSGVLGMKVLYNPNCQETNHDAMAKKIKQLQRKVSALSSKRDLNANGNATKDEEEQTPLVQFEGDDSEDDDELEDDGAGGAVGVSYPESEEEGVNKPESGDDKTDGTANTANRMNKKALPGDSFNSFKAFVSRKSSIGSK